MEFVKWQVGRGDLKSQELVSASQRYFDHNKHKLYCFGDLRNILTSLDESDLLQVLEHAGKTAAVLPSNDYGVPVINCLKLEYCLLFSSAQKAPSKPEVQGFVARCLRTYRGQERPKTEASPKTESHPRDDLCILGCMVLIRFSAAWENCNPEEAISDTALIRGAAILEYLLSDSPHNYQAILLLVRIYLLLGAGSLAMKTFSKLSVKQLQYETVGHNLFTRLATIHPHVADPLDIELDPQDALVRALSFYRSACISALRHRTGGLRRGSYVNIQGCIDLQKRLDESICRRMWALEVKRMKRLIADSEPTNRYDELGASDRLLHKKKKKKKKKNY